MAYGSYHIVALQEVKSVQVIERLISDPSNELDGWQYVVCDQAVGIGTHLVCATAISAFPSEVVLTCAQHLLIVALSLSLVWFGLVWFGLVWFGLVCDCRSTMHIYGEVILVVSCWHRDCSRIHRSCWHDHHSWRRSNVASSISRSSPFMWCTEATSRSVPRR
jgi:hypothetical protein